MTSGKAKTSFSQKRVLIPLGLFIAFLFLELGMRLAGFIISSLQEKRNKVSAQKKGAYGIMCIGESTTAGQYPPLLEEILNQRNTGVQFRVIDRGIIGTNTSSIVSQLESNLDRYKPDMVITMMGANDFGRHLPYEPETNSRIILFLRTFKTYKLMRFIWLHTQAKAREVRFYKVQGKDYSQENNIGKGPVIRQADFLQDKSNSQLIALGWDYNSQEKFTQAEDAFRKAIENNPQDDAAYVSFGWFCNSQGQISQAEDSFRKALELNPHNDGAHTGLGNLYQQHGEFSLAIESYKRAIQINPNNDTAYAGLGWCYQDRPGGDVVQFFKKAIEINPKNIWALFGLWKTYLAREEFSAAETVLKKAIEVDPKDAQAYLGLGDYFHKQRMTLQTDVPFRIIELFKQAIKLSPDKDMFYRGLARLYEDTGEENLAKEYYGKANDPSINSYLPLVASNYRRVKDILDERGIQLVCVQYPIRNIELLKRMFNEQGSIIFIDNEMIFKEAVRKGGYNKYFRDMFGGDFGHCTVEGNMLLAENIANGILEMFFGENKKIRLK